MVATVTFWILLTMPFQYYEPAETPVPSDTMPKRKTPPSNAIPKAKTPSLNTSALSESAPKPKKITACDRAFQQHLIDHGVYPKGYESLDDRGSVRPHNWEEIQEMMIQPRRSPSPSQLSDGTFAQFTREVDRALTEKTAVRKPLSTLLGNADIPSQDGLIFETLAPLTTAPLSMRNQTTMMDLAQSNSTAASG
jgi:hypothetical protein